MAASAKANNVILVEAFTPRWNKQMRTVRRLIANGEIGDVTMLDAGLSLTTANPDDIRFNKELAGGSLMDAGCYAVYAVRYAMSAEPISAAAIDRKRPGANVDTTFNGLLRFPGAGAVAHVWSSFEGPTQRVFKATGTKGIVTILDAFDEKSSVVITRGQDEEVMEMNSTNRFQVQLDEFSESILHGTPSEFPVEDGLRNMAAVLALYEAVDSGRTVDVEKI